MPVHFKQSDVVNRHPVMYVVYLHHVIAVVACQSACAAKPYISVVVLHHCPNGVAGQSVTHREPVGVIALFFACGYRGLSSG